MEKIIKFLGKYWTILSIVFTILSSVVTGGWWLYNRIDKLNDTVNETNQWVQTHDDSINDLHDDVLRLKTLEEAKEKGICK
jgi:hypothetical protein